jgi:hypothetical protein
LFAAAAAGVNSSAESSIGDQKSVLTVAKAATVAISLTSRPEAAATAARKASILKFAETDSRVNVSKVVTFDVEAEVVVVVPSGVTLTIGAVEPLGSNCAVALTSTLVGTGKVADVGEDVGEDVGAEVGEDVGAFVGIDVGTADGVGTSIVYAVPLSSVPLGSL